MLSNSILLTFGSAIIVSATQCLRNNFEEQVARVSCGDLETITQCLSNINLARAAEVEDCFSAGGCEQADAIIGAVYLAQECDELGSTYVREDLRRRADATTAVSTDAAASVSGSSSLICKTTAMISTKICSDFTAGPSKGEQQGCETTQVASTRCADGLICQTKAGHDICMVADNSLGTSGIIVTLVFGLGIASFLIALITMCVKERRVNKAAERERKAQLDSHKPNVEQAAAYGGVRGRKAKGPAASDINLPLIGNHRNERDISQNREGDNYFDGTHSPGNAGSPRTLLGPAPKLHPGLGALGQDNGHRGNVI